MKKKEISTNSIIKHLCAIEKEEKLNEKESQNYATDILINQKKSIIIHLIHSIFKKESTKNQISESLHIIKLFYILDPKNTKLRVDQVIIKEDFANNLLNFFFNLSNEEIMLYEDIFFILFQIYPKLNNEALNKNIINKFFNSLDLINEESNFSSLFYILMNINNLKQKEFFLIRSQHENYRIIDEYALKELNKTKNENDMLKILFYIYVIVADKSKCNLYRNDVEILIDELLYLMDDNGNKDIQIFVINVILEIISNEVFHLYKVEEIRNLFNNVIESDECDNIKDLCKKGINIINKN